MVVSDLFTQKIPTQSSIRGPVVVGTDINLGRLKLPELPETDDKELLRKILVESIQQQFKQLGLDAKQHEDKGEVTVAPKEERKFSWTRTILTTLISSAILWFGWISLSVFDAQAMQATQQKEIEQIQTNFKDSKTIINQNDLKIEVLKEQLQEQRTQTRVLEERSTNEKAMNENIFKIVNENNRMIRSLQK